MRRITLVLALAVLALGAAFVAWRMELRFYLDPAWQIPSVKLLDAGGEPRSALRNEHEKAPRPFTSVSQEALLTFRGVLQGEESEPPAVLLHWEPLTTERSWGVGITRWRVTAAEGVEGLADAVWVVRIGNRGELRVEAPSGLSPATAKVAERLRRLLAWTLAVPYPKEPVGKGARWTATWRAPVAVGADVEHVATYTLNDVSATGADLEVVCRLSGQPQHPSPHVVVDEIEGDYVGRIVLLFAEATPVQSEISFRAGMATVESENSTAPPTDEERRHGTKIVWRGRLLLQADAVGSLRW